MRIFDIVILDDNIDIMTNSIVEQPAIEEMFVLQSEQFKFNFDSDKHEITGPVLIPNKLIYRHDERLGEFYIRWTPQAIRQAYERSNMSHISLEHDGEALESVKLMRTWLTEDDEMWCKYKILDDELWETLKSKPHGFSIEANVGLELIQQSKQTKIINTDNMDINEVKALVAEMVQSAVENINKVSEIAPKEVEQESAEPQEEETAPEEVAEDTPDEEKESLKAENEELKIKVADLEAKIAELEKALEEATKEPEVETPEETEEPEVETVKPVYQTAQQSDLYKRINLFKH